VRSLIAMAHNLGLGIIAEGVETQAQAAFLLNEHCEEAQGYLYAKPLPAADFEAYLRIILAEKEGTTTTPGGFHAPAANLAHVLLPSAMDRGSPGLHEGGRPRRAPA
jgi:predicted signal transduction protein with EAL and GGDEF domain